ncbi:MAG: DnaD domain protein [Lachnospiraceae bacterium]|nr:DnaD domain protein [Lachnospiraceae bacterium]
MSKNMGQFTIYRDDYVDSTIISNRFIDEYMKDANDAQIKVYLYLIRMMSANLSTSVSEIADKFNHTEKDVIRALKYWEKNCLLSLEYDEAKVLTGIHLKDLCKKEAAGQGTAAALQGSAAPQDTPAPLPVSRAAAPAPVVTILSKTSEDFSKPTYSADDLRAFKNQENTAQLLFVAESYIGRPISASEMKSILYFSDCLHFSDDLIDYLIQYCVDRGKKDFKYIEAVALNWAQSGISTPKQAEKFSSKYDKSVYTIMKDLGKSNAPTSKEIEYINRWIKDYGFSADIISEACERTVLATDSHRFEYAEGILSSWKKENVRRKSDIQRIDELYQKRRQTKTAVPATNRFNQFSQRDYDFEELEAKLLSK